MLDLSMVFIGFILILYLFSSSYIIKTHKNMLLRHQRLMLGRKDGGRFVGAHNKCPNGGTFGRCAANITRAQEYEEQAETPTG